MKKSYADFYKQHVQMLELPKMADQILARYFGEYPALLICTPYTLTDKPRRVPLEEKFEKFNPNFLPFDLLKAEIPTPQSLKKIIEFLLFKQVENSTQYTWKNIGPIPHTPLHMESGTPYLFGFSIRVDGHAVSGIEGQTEIPITAFIEEKEEILKLFTLLNNQKILRQNMCIFSKNKIG